jgi:acyl-CoA synthetase (AMP-forming)/AMP-acid ligase II
MQVSPVEIENTLLAHPDRLIVDATVAGVSGGRTSDEKVPRAWVVLSETGKKRGEAAVVKALDVWARASLSKYKRLRGGIEVVREVRWLPVTFPFYLCLKTPSLSRFPSLLRGKCCAEYCRISMTCG